MTTSFSARLRRLASAHPHTVAITLVSPDGAEEHVTWAELDSGVDAAAAGLAARGLAEDSLLVVALPSGKAHFHAVLAGWRLGACVLPISHRLPAPERDQILDLARTWRRTLVVAGEPLPGHDHVTVQEMYGTAGGPPQADRVPHPGKAICSGGSTGRPKIIIDPQPWARTPGDLGVLGRQGLASGQTQLVTGQLYHNIAFTLSYVGLFERHHLVVMKKFDAALAVDLVERHRVTFAGFVPTMMQRIARLPGITRRDFSSFEALYHSGASMPEWVKRTWLDLVPPERQYDVYGTAEAVGRCLIRGDEWLARPGSVGRPDLTEIRILDDDGAEVPPGTVGTVYMRRTDVEGPTFHYVGASAPPATPDGLVAMGDLGWLDEEGYLYLADRRLDLIVTGGANVYPAEVESAISSHPAVRDVAVVGLTDEEWGKRVHAVVELAAGHDPERAPAELDAHLRARLAAYKVPKTYEFVARMPRDESGKIRRQALVLAHEAASDA